MGMKFRKVRFWSEIGSGSREVGRTPYEKFGGVPFSPEEESNVKIKCGNLPNKIDDDCIMVLASCHASGQAYRCVTIESPNFKVLCALVPYEMSTQGKYSKTATQRSPLKLVNALGTGKSSRTAPQAKSCSSQPCWDKIPRKSYR